MTETSLQTLLGLTRLDFDLRIVVEALLALASALGAVALRRRLLVIRAPGLALIAIGFITDITMHLTRNAPRLTVWLDAIGLVLFFFGAVRIVLEILDWSLHRGKLHFSTILRDLLLVVFYVAVVMAVLRITLRVDLTPLIATSAVISVVLGFGLQETLGNIFSGLSLQLQRAFAPGDWVRFGTYVGRIQGIGWRSTRIVTRSNERVEIPNSMLSKDVLANYSSSRVADELFIGITYNEPPNRVKDVVQRVLANVPEVLSQPAAEVHVVDYGDFAIKYRIRFWMSDYTVQERVRDTINSSLWYSLRRHAIDIPYPVRTLYVHQVRPADELKTEQDQRTLVELRQVDFLSALSDEDLSLLLPNIRIHQFGSGEVLMRQGEVGDCLHILRHGTVEVLAHGKNGGGLIHIRDLSAPCFFGEIALLTGERRTATVRAHSDVEVLEVNRDGFAHLFKARPETATEISAVLTTRLKETRERVSAATSSGARAPNENWLLIKMREIFDI